MRRRGISRILLFGLVVVTVLLVVRIFNGTSDGDALVAFESDLKVDQLRHRAFAVRDRAVKLQISATGSLQSDSVLAAYPWIIDGTGHQLVWVLDPDRAIPGPGMTISEEDVVTLQPGRYDAYFTSYGDPLRPASPPTSFFDRISAAIDSDFQRWRTEKGHWRFTIQPVTPEDRRLVVTVSSADRPEDENLIWSTGPVGSGTVAEYLFETARDVDVRVRSVGELYGRSVDAGWIEDIESGVHVWDMSTAKTEPAGGSIRNRECSQSVSLPAGRFRAVFQSDDRHAFGDWRGNPPYDPSAWGMEITAYSSEDALAVSQFDPWESLPRVASLTGIGNEQLVSYTFTLEKPMRVMVYSLGEGYPKRGKMFDYSWIVGAGEREVWKMTIDQTSHAGGSSKNRRAETILDLDAGVPYTVYYKTDDSHAYDDWNDDPPLHPEQWGVTIFALDPDYVPDVNIPVAPPAPPVTKPGYAATGGKPLVSLQSIGNGANVSQRFTLNDSATVHIYALGEMTRDGRYDWGWISNVDTGALVWEMRRENSVSAGGTSKNRLVDVLVRLPRGRYEAHYVTDDTHAFPDFRYGGAPDNPTAWGMTVQLVEKGNGTP